MNILDTIEKEQLKDDVTPFNVGDTVKVHCRVIEGGKERVQIFQGIVIARRGSGVVCRAVAIAVVPRGGSLGFVLSEGIGDGAAVRPRAIAPALFVTLLPRLAAALPGLGFVATPDAGADAAPGASHTHVQGKDFRRQDETCGQGREEQR